MATQVDQIQPGVYRWNVYSPEHRCDLTSHAVQHGFQLLLFDPIPVSPEVLDWFPPGPPTAILLTNRHHERAALEWRARFDIPIWASDGSGIVTPGVRSWGTAAFPFRDWTAVALPGGSPGETAFRLAARSLVVIGDAVVNLADRGLEVLPDKYCSDPQRLRQALGGLVKTPFERALLAHGSPLLNRASDRIGHALEFSSPFEMNPIG
jgi:glyoxylase-like metal-dependent hydrolase (beta-lactamase superfamily II)